LASQNTEVRLKVLEWLSCLRTVASSFPSVPGIGHGGLEYALTEISLALGVLLAGSGKYSLASVLPASVRKL
jgi:hypothetical protein